MEEHQNNTDAQNTQADSDEGAPKVIKAGSEAKPGRRVLRSGPGNGSHQMEASEHGAAEAARSIMRAGQQALEGAEAAAYAADESTGGGRVLDEWIGFVRRASVRNTQAVSDLMHCYTVSSFLQWQSHLLNATVADLWETNTRVLQLMTHRA